MTHGSPVRPRSIRKRRADLPNEASQHGSRHPRGVIAAIMAEVLRACVIAKSERRRRPFGWGCSRKRRKIAEATPRSQKVHAWYPRPVLAGGEPNHFGAPPALHV